MDIYEGNDGVFLIFDDKIVENFSIKKKKSIYSKLKDKKKYSSVLNNLHINADEDSKLYNKRKIAKTFNPSIDGLLLIKNEKIRKLEDDVLLEEFDKLCRRIENDYGLNIFNYVLNEVYEEKKQERYFEIETFNYNFISHRTVKSNLASDFVKELNNFIERNFFKNIKENTKKENTKKIDKEKDAKKNEKAEIKTAKNAAEPKLKPAAKPQSPLNTQTKFKKKSEPEAMSETMNTAAVKKTEPKVSTDDIGTAVKKTESKVSTDDIHTTIEKTEPKVSTDDIGTAVKKTESKVSTDIHSEISLIALSWSSLSPKDTAPVLEEGTPAEINHSSWIRMYFQKPMVRKVVWRLRDKSDTDNLKPLLRVYADENMLWYETLDSVAGDKYIILSEEIELSRVWAEIGYVDEKNEFIFIARTPVWPPECLFKSSLIRYSLKKSLHNKICLIGATENLPEQNNTENTAFTSSGGGFYGLNK